MQIRSSQNYYASGEIRGQVADGKTQAATAVRSAPIQGAAGKLVVAGNSLRFQGPAGSNLQVTLADAAGRRRAQYRLSLGSDGFSSAVDMSGLAPGLYYAGWKDGAALRRAAFVRP